MGDEGAIWAWALRAKRNDKAAKDKKPRDRSKLMILTSFSHELRTSLNGMWKADVQACSCYCPC